jgi:hypothetical protein
MTNKKNALNRWIEGIFGFGNILGFSFIVFQYFFSRCCRKCCWKKFQQQQDPVLFETQS